MTPPTFTYPLMEMLCKELQERVIHLKVVGLLPNDLHRFWMILRGKEKQEALFFCLTSPFMRFHLVTLSTVPKATSSHPLFSFLHNATVQHVELLQHDRILQITFLTSQGERKLVAEFFSKHPNYYLLKSDGTILFALHPLSQSHYQSPPSRPFHAGNAAWHSHQEVEHAYTVAEKQWTLIQEKHHLSHFLSKEIKGLEKKERALLENLKQCSEWEKVQHEGDLIKAHFASMKKGASAIRVHDWVSGQSYDLALDPKRTPQEEMAKRYKRAKKLQAGQVPLTQQLEKTQNKLRFLRQQQQQLQSIQTLEELAAFKNVLPSFLTIHPTTAQAAASVPIYREYQSACGVKIWVGKNAKSNDRLTFQLANGRDWWLHARDHSGSHVIIRLGKDQEPDSETLQDALQLALYYSQARQQEEGEICYTQRKYVTRFGKKKTGRVQFSKHQIAWVRLDPIRLQALKDRHKEQSENF